MAIKPDETVASVTDSSSDSTIENQTPSEIRSEQPASDEDTRDVRIIVCSTCRKEDGTADRPTPGEQLFDATFAANEGNKADETGTQGRITVTSVECLGNCTRRLSAAVVTEEAWTYVFGDLSIDNAGDLIEGARLMRETTNGLMPWRGRPQCLKSGMVARIPPTFTSPEAAPLLPAKDE